ncbi:MAG TPA: NADH-quinone oxidoreductase subunit NuoB [Deltaproteobacteria bacterium]|nr:NADH-quinone oxidoreductase subunit NuoB [Deltaproteobacteria bacterium]
MGMRHIGYATRTIPKFLEPLPGGAKTVDAIEFVVAWARANSLWPLIYGTACCAMEMMSTGSSRHDWARFGVEVARATPRQADLIVLAGTIVEKMGSRLVTLYEQMPGPKYVIAMGSCAISGGPFYYDSYSVIKGGDRLIPVDVYIPGCPPRPEALLYGIMQLQEKIRTEGRRNPWKIGTLNQTPFGDPLSEAKKVWADLEKSRTAPSPAISDADSGNIATDRPKPIKRPATEQFPEVARNPLSASRLDNETIFACILENFPETTLTRQSEHTVEQVRALGPEYLLDLTVPLHRYVEMVAFLKNSALLDMNFLLHVTAVDRLDRFEVLAHLLSADRGHNILVRCALDRQYPEIPSLSPLFAGAIWHEREVFDLFGIRFSNHPDLRRLFLEDNFPGHPLRKDFDDPSRVVRRPY